MLKSQTTLYACCLPVQGYRRSLICDLQKQKIDFIPNALYEILTKDNIFSIEAIKAEIESIHHSTIDEYFSFLYENDYIFDVLEEEILSFPKIDLIWLKPDKISNAIFDIKKETLKKINFKSIADELDTLGCKAIQFRVFNLIDFFELEYLLGCFSISRTKHIDFVLPYSDFYENNVKTFEKISEEHQRLQFVTFYSSPTNFIRNESQFNKLPFIYSEKKVSSHIDCGKISSDDFYSNIYLFTEAQLHNTCLNRKIAIDVDGNIKNCPSMPHSYGNIKDTTLREALEHPDFKKYWYIHKDQIEVCKDCEFRYICTDCRAYLEDPHNLYSKPLKCGYNPYTCEWEEWSTNPLKQQAIEYYGMQELVKKRAGVTTRPSD
jgi:SPASM domain peptide maturase of grasp-with-spasm system